MEHTSDEDIYPLSDECDSISEVESSASDSAGEDQEFLNSPTSLDLEAYFDFSDVSDSEDQTTTQKRPSNSMISRRAKRQHFHFNASSKPTTPFINIFYLGEAENRLQNTDAIFNIEQILPNFYLPYTNWESRFNFVPELTRVSNSGLNRVDLAVYAIEANTETNSQISKSNYRRCLSKMRTPIECFYPELWDTDTARERLKEFPLYNEPYEDAIKVSNILVVHLVFICCIIVRYYMLFPNT